ncbi:hypothetical protein B4U79_10059 [Dinothrombium tinctorium]|uniref:Pre-mRNA-splicing factor ISY1-like protein n=1 Tax=Dinothrombium tinctorium TaxID=1965070 RepID=A0A443RMW5_9ACAR|nr:hypothetical protein B4U79_10059 [Dinothrombium tinctorium]
MTTLARWRAAQLEGEKANKKRRPFLASECDDLKEAEKWRLDIIRSISKKVTQIQNAGLGEFRIRDLNDQINKLLREKRHWEQRIQELGGNNYKKLKGPKFDTQGKEPPGSRGYKYFGAAKDLPGVRELFAQEAPIIVRKTRAELMRDIDADYYGYRDEDDGVIVPLERAAEKEAIAKALEKEGKIFDDEMCSEEANKYADEGEGIDFAGPRNFVSHVPSIPTQEQIRQQIVERKKAILLEKYLSGNAEETSE